MRVCRPHFVCPKPRLKPQTHVDIAWDKTPSLCATSLIITPKFPTHQKPPPPLVLALMVVFSQTPGWSRAGEPGRNTITEAELSSGMSETQRCRWTGRWWRTSYWKLFAQLAIALREFVFTPNTALQRHWPDEGVGGYCRGFFGRASVVAGDWRNSLSKTLSCVALVTFC